MQLLVDIARQLSRNTRNRLEFLAGRGEEALGGAEVTQEGALAGRPDALQAVEHPLQQLRGLRAGVEIDRRRPTREEDLLLALGQRDDSGAAFDEGAEGAQRRAELALAAIDDDQRGQRGEALVALAVVRGQ